MKEIISYRPFSKLKRGQLSHILKVSYDDWSEYSECLEQWNEYDSEVFDFPDTVGRCGFFTELEGDVIGFISWDPRTRPYAIIGHNCILPQYRNHGYGLLQVLEVLQLLQKQDFDFVRVSTKRDPYFKTARKMYESAGFHECVPYRNDGENMIYYEAKL